MKMKMIMTMLMILSSIDIEVIRTVFYLYFFMMKFFKHLKHKQRIQVNIQQIFL